jgi:4-hydroxy-tetrahydrodipicolinate reductase
MNIILLGYGKMGKTIERIAVERGHTIAARIDADNQADLNTATGDVVIEFSHPDAAFENIRKCLERGLPVISGTTGWLGRKGEIEALCAQKQGTFFYASNYSLGVNIFFKVNEFLSRIMSGFDNYEPLLAEIHHTEKKDAPSGTAITLAEGVLKYVSRKKSWVHDQATHAPSELEILSSRVGLVPGTHSVKYTSSIDDIEIKHTAHTRDGFALGAVVVAEWIKDRKGVLNMDDFLKF